MGEAPVPQYSTVAKAWVRANVTSSGERTVSKLGRYELRGVLGSGGMGTVFDAFDPELRRHVAIKVIRDDIRRDARDLRDRILVEARALASLSHPNLVDIYEIGHSDGEPFIVMERIEGMPLDEWLFGPRRSWMDVLEAFRAAGEGLAACHQVGIVHRDFKPSNVIVGNDGFVRLIDLGLVRLLENHPARHAGPLGSHEGTKAEHQHTHHGLGTLAFLAPEGLMRGDASKASDQFAFCTALYHALYGILPFGGNTPAQRLRSIRSGILARPMRRSRVPTSVRSVITRGLSFRASDRHPSMRALLDTLNGTLTRRRRRRVIALSLCTAVGVGLVANPSHSPRHCEDQISTRTLAWQHVQRPSIAAALGRSEHANAEFTASRVDEVLSAYEQELVEEERRACIASNTGTRDAHPRKRCAERRRADFHGIVQLLATARPDDINRAVSAASSLPSVSDCETAERSLRPRTASTSYEAQLSNVLARARAEIMIGRYEEGLETVERVVVLAHRHGHHGRLAEAQLLEGYALTRTNRVSEGLTAFEDAFYGALAGAEFPIAVLAAGALASTEADQMRLLEAEHWARHAEALHERLRGAARRAATIDLENTRAIVAIRSGDLNNAVARMNSAVARASEDAAVSPTQWTWMLSNLASMQTEAGKLDEALQTATQAIVSSRNALGPAHPLLASALESAALVESELYRLDDAEAKLSMALDILQPLLGDDDPRVATTVLNLAVVQLRRGRFELAGTLIDRAEATYRNAAPGHPLLAVALTNRAWANVRLGRPEDAIAAATRAVDLARAVAGETHPRLAPMLEVLGRAQTNAGDFDRARQSLDDAANLRESAYGAGSPETLVGTTASVILEHRRGALSSARATCRKHAPAFESALEPDGRIVELLITCADVEAQSGDAFRADRWARQAVTNTAGQDPNYMAWRAHRARARHALDPTDARRSARVSVEMAAALGLDAPSAAPPTSTP